MKKLLLTAALIAFAASSAWAGGARWNVSFSFGFGSGYGCMLPPSRGWSGGCGGFYYPPTPVWHCPQRMIGYYPPTPVVRPGEVFIAQPGSVFAPGAVAPVAFVNTSVGTIPARRMRFYR